MIKKPFIWVIIIFICAAIFRLTNLDLIEFKLDEARDVYEMERFWSEPYFIQRGTIQSTGVYNPPLWYYILAVLSAPSRDPQYLSFMIGLINCVAVAGFYWVVRKFYGQIVGIASGLLMAFSPWLIIFSRKIWAPDMILALAVPLFYFLHVIYQGRTSVEVRPLQKWAWFWIMLLLSLLAQLHASGIFLGLASIIIITIITVIRKIKPNFKFALFGLCLSLIPLTPYLIYQFQTGCEDCQAYLTYRQGEVITAEPVFDTNAFIRPFQLINGSGFSDVLGEEGYMQFLEEKPIVRIFSFLFLLEFLLLPVGVWYLFLRTPGRSQSPPSRWLGWPILAIFAVVPLFVFLTKTPAHLYYFLIISPIVILIYSLGIFALRSHLVQGATFIIIIVINIIFNLSFFEYLSKERSIPGDYGSVYKLKKHQAADEGMKVEEFVISAAQVEQ